jgi:hypothetical protein
MKKAAMAVRPIHHWSNAETPRAERRRNRIHQ